MAIKEMELGFDLMQFSDNTMMGLIKFGRMAYRRGDLKFVETKSPDVKIGYEKEGRNQNLNLDFYVFFNEKCVGAITFAYDEAPDELVKLFRGKRVAVPHVFMLPEARGLGYPLSIYGLAIKKGTVLVSDHHTNAAAKLWEAVAKMTKARIAYTCEENGWKLSSKSVDPFDWKVLYR